MTRPVLTREARERCEHTMDGWDGQQWCAQCGVVFVDEHPKTDDLDCIYSDIDWPATEAADREQLEKDGQQRLPL